MKRTMLGVAVCMAAGLACSETRHGTRSPSAEGAQASSGPVLSGTVGEGTATATATVQSVDMSTRRVTLRNSDGTTVAVVAGPSVRNLAQVKRGDVLRVTYRQSLSYEVNRPGSATSGVATTTDVRRAPPGEMPAGTITDTTSVRATIANIDKPNAQVTLRGPEGRTTVVTVKDPSKLDRVQVGDVIDIRYTEALELAVEKGASR